MQIPPKSITRIRDTDIHPIALAGFQMMRLELPHRTNGPRAGEKAPTDSSTPTPKTSSSKENAWRSAAVAAYEPILGGEENPFREPLPYRERIKLAPDNFYYDELPVGESLFPAPVVGYSEVKVESINNQEVTRTGTGYTVNKYYTARDFPVRVDFTDKERSTVRRRPNPILKFFKLNLTDLLASSQGFAIEVNDMHGKPKEISTYNQAGALIASTKYHYRLDDPDADELHLNNDVQVANSVGEISGEKLGIYVDLWQNMHEEQNETIGAGVALSLRRFA